MSHISSHLNALFNQSLHNHQQVVHLMGTLYPDFEKLTLLCVTALQAKKKILFFGNGGSASDAQHLATELVVRFHKNRPAIAALALSTDPSTLTAIGNDLGFESLFERQIEALGNPGDVAIGISTSGRSPNVLRGLAQARDMGLVCAAFTGQTGGDLFCCTDVLLCVPSMVTAHIQEMHIWVGHTLCAAIEDVLYKEHI